MIRLGIEKDINEALLKDIMAIYADAEDKMLKAVAKRVAKGIKTEGWNEQKLQETQKLNKELAKLIGNVKKLSNSKVSKGIIEAYKQGKLEVGDKGIHETILDELEIPMNLKMQVLAANNLLNNASFQVLRNANDAYQQIMANATTGLLAGTDTRIQATQKMLNEFASKGITTFVDKAGRNWSLASYAEMCTRTVTAHAALQGHIDRQLEVGEDLVKVSSIGTTCPICMRWQGVVLSISGNSPKYHSVDEAKAAGLFHPNCKHTLGMYIPELDDGTEHEGKVEPMSQEEANNQYGVQRNKLIEKQRANERMIRYWKNRKALAMTPEEKAKCDEKVKKWQYTNMLHCEKNGLRRQYAREGVMVGNPEGPMGTFIGGSLKEFEQMYDDIIGEKAKKVYNKLKMNLQLFAKKYDKWLKDEIMDLDQLDIDKAMMKDSKNKAVTPTSLYKKYIGDSPMKDYTEISLYEKGSKEFKSHYAKWLKQQIEEIGVSYKVKPKYTEVHEDIPDEDKKLSATEIYKKYHDGEKPTEAYKKLGGEEGTGMKYGKWVETQKKELIKNGITKTVPFENNEVNKTAQTIGQANQAVENAKKLVGDAQLKSYKEELDATVHGQYDAYLKVKEITDKLDNSLLDDSIDDDAYFLLKKKLEIAKEKHIEMVKKKAKKLFGTEAFSKEYEKLYDMYEDEPTSEMKDHLFNQIKVYDDLKKANDPLAKYDEVEQWYIDDIVKKSKNPSDFDLETFKDAIDYLQKLIDTNDESWEFYKQVSQKLELNKEAFEGTLLMTESEKKAFLTKKKAKEKSEKEKAKFSTKVSIGREVSFKDGQLVNRDRIYNELSLSDLENLSSQVEGHSLFSAEHRRDILGRDRIDGHNHHMGHDVALKSGLTNEQKKLGQAFQLAYDEYFNTIKCGPINQAYLMGYENASPSMRKKIDAMNMCIQSCELNEPILLHRYVDEGLVEAIFKTSDVHSIKKYEVFENNTFMSTATGGHPTFGKRPYMITLQCDKGTHALPTINHEELEVLLGKGKLEFMESKTHTSSKPYKLQNYDGSYTNFVGDEIVVRYIEDGRAAEYDVPTPEKIDEMLQGKKNVSHHKSESKPWIDSLSKDERKASDRYTGSWYTDMNNVYRKNDTSDKKVTKFSEDLTNALHRAETDKPVVLRRGVNESDLAHMLGFNGDTSKLKKHWDEINAGDFAAEDKGFLSTSPDASGGFSKKVELRIYCPSKTHAAYVDSISTHKGEKETLLNSGSMYRVLQLKEEGNKTIAYLELLGTD